MLVSTSGKVLVNSISPLPSRYSMYLWPQKFRRDLNVFALYLPTEGT